MLQKEKYLIDQFREPKIMSPFPNIPDYQRPNINDTLLYWCQVHMGFQDVSTLIMNYSWEHSIYLLPQVFMAQGLPALTFQANQFSIPISKAICNKAKTETRGI